LRTRILRQRVDLLVGRETALLLLGEFQLAVDRNLEHAAARPHIGDLGAGNLCEPRSHTESARLIGSGYAVFDDDLHGHARPLAVKGKSGFIRYLPYARREPLLGTRSKQAEFPARAKKVPRAGTKNPLPRRTGNLVQRAGIAGRINAGKRRIGPQMRKFPAKIPAST